jgi:CRISPR-associated protein Cas2
MVSLLYCHLYDHEPKKLTSSVFEGNLNLSGIERLKHEMLRVVDKEKDSLIIYILDDTANYKREILTNVKDPTDNLL